MNTPDYNVNQDTLRLQDTRVTVFPKKRISEGGECNQTVTVTCDWVNRMIWPERNGLVTYITATIHMGVQLASYWYSELTDKSTGYRLKSLCVVHR